MHQVCYHDEGFNPIDIYRYYIGLSVKKRLHISSVNLWTIVWTKISLPKIF